MLLLATELRLAVLSELNLLDLISISHLDQDFRKLANDVLQRRIRKNLIGFLPLVTHDPFWALLNDTRSVVGGTSALQVCLGQSLDNNKLSLYVPRGALDVWISFWQREGFRTPKGKGTAAPLRLNHVLSQAMLVHKSKNMRVEIIESQLVSFVPALLSSATTAHMNFFTKTRVICPYPKLLQNQRALIASEGAKLIKSARKKLTKLNISTLSNMAFQSYPCRSSCPALERSSSGWRGGVVMRLSAWFDEDYTTTAQFHWRLHEECWNPRCYSQWIKCE